MSSDMITNTEKPTTADWFAETITQAKTFPVINAAVVGAQEAYALAGVLAARECTTSLTKAGPPESTAQHGECHPDLESSEE
jgi:hypothetical protein